MTGNVKTGGAITAMKTRKVIEFVRLSLAALEFGGHRAHIVVELNDGTLIMDSGMDPIAVLQNCKAYCEKQGVEVNFSINQEEEPPDEEDMDKSRTYH